MTISDSELDALLREHGAKRVSSSPGERTMLVANASKKVRASRPRRIWVGVTAAIATGMIAIPGTAFAIQQLSAQTGVIEDFSSPGGPAEKSDEDWTRLSVPGSEWLEGTATDFEIRIQQLTPVELPLPESTSWPEVTAEVSKRMTTLVSSAESEETNPSGVWLQDFTIEADYEQILWRAWVNEWIAAHADSDEQRMQSAVAAMRSSLTWPAFATDTGGDSDLLTITRRIWVDRVSEGDSHAAQALAEEEDLDTWDGVSRMDLIVSIDRQARAEAGK
ncbi:hypothetical protein EDF60_1589 [Leucobacter luti]|uniref:hypothetical protein n=1 Tax=Leucobacter luti TaxID=340320 RepID=UPI0010E3347F|nr:hypothetical protein [Leucobacter luti]MCW2286944.1 hypothetical protein [Leucobacter luti]TCK41171.1 hypothetical protein EDF60_1589 [Leucobacter luti]